MRLGTVVLAVSCSTLLACGDVSPSSLEFVEISPEQPKLGDVVTIKFRAVDSRGQPQAGALVEFSLQSENPAVKLSPTSAGTNKGDGIASTQLIASGRVASVVVIATSGDKTAVSPPIAFAGAAANHKQMVFQCGPISSEGSGGVHAIGAYDETRHLIAGVRLDCFVHVGDRNGDGLSNVQVTFLTEAGTIAPTGITDDKGTATALYQTSYPLPKDVSPGTFSWTPPNDSNHTGEYIAPLWMHPFEWVSNPVTQYGQVGVTPNLQEPRRADPIRPGRSLNSRDNLVSMIAITTGEEAFDDINNNGRYDNGEPYTDLTEPFVDDNDNGTWDQDERYVDTNGNGRWDGKNGVYDASTLIWVQERILWTGIPHPRDVVGTAEPVFRLIEPTGPVNLPHFGSVQVILLLADPWFNTIASNAEGDGCGTLPSEDEPLVVALPSRTGGLPFTYPAFALLSYQIKDAHKLTPPDPPHNPAVNFIAPLRCEFTATPHDDGTHTVIINTGAISGTVL
ncbi:MAG: hypothetical protein ACOZIN_21385 [Myxococcota bacterium]